MSQESIEAADSADIEFKAKVFASDPKLYYELFEKESHPEGEMEEVIPESPEEFQSLMKAMAREGLVDP